MKKLEESLIDLVKGSNKMEYKNILLGQESHPKRLKTAYKIPEYISQFGAGEHDFFELAAVIKGKCVMTMGGKSYLLEPGDLCFIKYNIKHFESYFKENSGYEILWIAYSSVFRIRIYNAVYEPKNKYRLFSSIIMKVKPETFFMLEKIATMNDPKKNINEIKSLLKKWLAAVQDNLKKKKYEMRVYTDKNLKSAAVRSKRMEKAMQYLAEHYNEKIRLKDIAAEVGLSPAYFATLFYELYYHPLHEYITELRMKKAFQLLKTSNLNVNEIAYKVGYGDNLFFRHIFKKYTGISPREFRGRDVPAPAVISPSINP